MNNWIALYTIVRREVIRFFRIWSQTLLPPVVTVTLYFIIFGTLVGSKVTLIENVTFSQYIAPGLIMMSVIMNAYSNVSSSFFSSKFMRNIEELIIAPVSPVIILMGYLAGGVLRGLIVALLVTFVSLFFTHLQIHNYLVMFVVSLFSAILFSLTGFLNALFAKKFDDISFVPTFVITPLIYLGGVFYPISKLPPFWHTLSLLNPIAYVVSAFRYGFIGVSDVNLNFAYFMIFFCTLVLFYVNLWMLKRGYGLKS